LEKSAQTSDFANADEADAFRWFCGIRWPETNGRPVCPKCRQEGAYWYAGRRLFRCYDTKCRKDFTPTSGTRWHSRKLKYAQIRAIMTDLAENNPSAHQLAVRHDINPKAATYIKRRMKDGHHVCNK
jgi:transposase-like protein